MLIISIDPGLRGALCCYEIKNRIERVIEIIDIPLITKEKEKDIDIYKIKEWITKYKKGEDIRKIIIEQQIVMKGQGLSSTGKTMKNYGLLCGLVIGLDLELEIVGAKKWQKGIRELIKKEDIREYNYKESKLIAIAYVEKYHKRELLFSNKRQRKPKDGRADAIAIAKYAACNINNEERI